MTDRQIEIGVTCLLLAMAVLMGWGAVRMPAGTVSMPGPGLVPLTLAVLLGAASLAHMLSAARAPPGEGEPARAPHDTAARGRIAIMLAAIAAAALLLERIGYMPTAALFLFVMLWSLSSLRWWGSALAALAGAWLSLLFFRDVLAVALPRTSFALPF